MKDQVDKSVYLDYNGIIMTQKVIKVGTSAAVIIPKKSMKELGLKPGDMVNVETNKKTGSFSIRPVTEISNRQERIAELTLNFINRYRKDLESLADK